MFIDVESVEQRGLCGRRHVAETSEMTVGEFGDLATARRAFQEAFLDEERFVDLLDCAGMLADGGTDGCQANGPP